MATWMWLIVQLSRAACISATLQQFSSALQSPLAVCQMAMQLASSRLLRSSLQHAINRTKLYPPVQLARSVATEAVSDTAGSQAQSAPKLIVFGGRGFVGSYVCREALRSGLHVVGISRSGTPPVSGEPWTREVEWVRGNLLEPLTYREQLVGAAAAISCVGGFGSQEEMLKVNGTANVLAIETAKDAGVPRFVFISATIPKLPGLGMLVGGYINGKAMAEEAVRKHYPETGVFLRPSVIYGDRVVSSSVTLPLGYVFKPVESLLVHCPKTLVDLPVVGGLLVPPVSAEAVARAAIAAATDSSFAAGVAGVDVIQRYK